jgi:hypothetical protein
VLLGQVKPWRLRDDRDWNRFLDKIIKRTKALTSASEQLLSAFREAAEVDKAPIAKELLEVQAQFRNLYVEVGDKTVVFVGNHGAPNGMTMQEFEDFFWNLHAAAWNTMVDDCFARLERAP